MHQIMAGLFSYYKPNFQNSEKKQSRKRKCLEISGRKEFTHPLVSVPPGLG